MNQFLLASNTISYYFLRLSFCDHIDPQAHLFTHVDCQFLKNI
jgi:hypothetical protein